MIFMRKFFLSIIFIPILTRVNSRADDYFDLWDTNFETNDLFKRLNGCYEGDTFSLSDLSNILILNKMDDDVYEMRFSSDIMDLFERKILIGQIDLSNEIIRIEITFCNQDNTIVLDDYGNQIQLMLIPHDFGHLLDLVNQQFSFSYMVCRLVLQPNCNFDPRTLFFHCATSSSIEPKVSKCTDGIKNQDETGLDCGGKCAPKRKCLDGSNCVSSKDCQSRFCASNICIPSHYKNQMQDGGESGIDCGGQWGFVMKCNNSQSCNVSFDCQSDVCVSKTCLPNDCNNGVKDPGEAGVDCGGECAVGRKCDIFSLCNASSDCLSNLCESNLCSPAHCNNSKIDEGETDVDCSGPCAPIKKCPVYAYCNSSRDCGTEICNSGICDIRTCLQGCGQKKVCFNGFCLRVALFGISMAWSQTGDGDLYVQTPTGKLIYYGNDDASSETDGGKHHRDEDRYGPENISWKKNVPPNGTYHICYNCHKNCVENDVEVTTIIRKPDKAVQKITKKFNKEANRNSNLEYCNSSMIGYMGSVEYP
ncbi:unnamed protein product [Adineta ricciae]|uniref:Uncharacterized protein n=1 Tax=Adineta ricciae TaxID=249248 RepID=A0A815IGU5_ADIRI|nr:unnamed protein product [Adineta ricciae]